MPVLSRKQYIKQEKKPARAKAPAGSVVLQEKKVVKEPLILWHLFHPDTPEEGARFNFSSKMIVGKNEYQMDCIESVVKTTIKPLADYLIMQGWFLRREEKIGEGHEENK